VQIATTFLLIVNGFAYSEIIYDNTILKILENNRETFDSVIGLVEDKIIRYYRGVMEKINRDVLDKIVPSRLSSPSSEGHHSWRNAQANPC